MFNKQTALRTARGNMALAMIFTIVNIVLYFLNIGASFPFSLFSPFLTGAWSVMSLMEGDTFGLILYAAIFILVMGAFLASWLLSKAKPKLMLIGLLVYLGDTGFMIWFYSMLGDNGWILDGLFHLWIIVSMGYAIYISFTSKPQVAEPTVEDLLKDYERV